MELIFRNQLNIPSPSAPEECGPAAYPARPEMVPTGVFDGGRYTLRFAENEADLREIQRLRFEIFNEELGEGLEESYATGLDRDPFDAICHHLIVTHKESGAICGTYRLLAGPLDSCASFYSNGEFELKSMPEEILREGVETGRACVHQDHRNGRVITLLWRGIGRYLTWNKKRYLFGCCSVPSLDEAEILGMRRALLDRGRYHESIRLRAQPGAALTAQEPEIEESAKANAPLPSLFSSYLKLGAKVCSEPALDREFKVSDFMILLDLEAMDPRIRGSFTNEGSWQLFES